MFGSPWIALIFTPGKQSVCSAEDLSETTSTLGVDVICIDEAKFFDDLYDFYCNDADLDGTMVIVAGLDGDYLRKGSS